MKSDILNFDTGFPAGLGTVIFGAVFSVCAAFGIRSASSLGIGAVSYADRYTGIDGAGFIQRFSEALLYAAPCLTIIFLLFILSFSPLLFPSCVCVVGVKGFLYGVAVTAVKSTGGIIQAGAYAVSTTLICIGAVYFLIHKEDILKKAGALLAISGGCVICEILLSYII